MAPIHFLYGQAKQRSSQAPPESRLEVYASKTVHLYVLGLLKCGGLPLTHNPALKTTVSKHLYKNIKIKFISTGKNQVLIVNHKRVLQLRNRISKNAVCVPKSIRESEMVQHSPRMNPCADAHVGVKACTPYTKSIDAQREPEPSVSARHN